MAGGRWGPSTATLPNSQKCCSFLDRRVCGGAPFPKACQKPIPGEGRTHWPHSPLFAPARGLCTRALLCDGVLELAMPTWRRVGAQGRRMSHLRLGRHCLKICQCASLIIFQQTTGASAGGGVSRRGSRPAQTGRQEEAAGQGHLLPVIHGSPPVPSLPESMLSSIY